MTVLVIGSNGQLGWEVMRRAPRVGLACRGLTRSDLDITDRVPVLAAVDTALQVVINAAAYTAVDKAESDPEMAFAVNRDGAAHIAEACARVRVPLIQISTDYVFDGSKVGAYVEDDPVAPLCVYGASKLAGENAVRQICPQHVILRTAWLFGVHGLNFVKTMLRLGRKQESLQVVDDQRGSPTFAGDLADAVLTLAARFEHSGPGPSGYGVFHCAGAGATTRCALASKLFEIAKPALGSMPAVQPITTSAYPTRARRPANSVLDCSRLKAVHGIALRQWEPALAEMLDALLGEEAVESGPRKTAKG
jgi:dTDP-4-dehydrorhamnose reductase